MSHHHHHSHSPKDIRGKKLFWVILLNLVITIAQVVGGFISNSLALLSDALHNMGDTAAIVIAWIANKVSRRKADERNTFGYKRFQILAAFFNALVLLSICIFLFYEAYNRLMDPQPVKSLIMMIVATVGLLGNLISVLILKENHQDNLNVKAAYLHLLGDTLSSVAVIIGGLFMWLYEIYWIDPVITFGVGIYIFIHTWHVLKETYGILMQATPPEINPTEIKNRLQQIDDVDDIHHVHVWRLDDSSLFFEAHVNAGEDFSISETERVRKRIERILEAEFNINHVTLQFEYMECGDAGGLINNK
jgi:cobalt-zinc-cadmium efflux system protein